MKKKLITLLLFLLSVSYCHAENRKANIALLIPLSGSYAPIGIDARQGAQIAIEESGSTANYIFLDSKNEAPFAITEFSRAINLDHIVAGYALRGPVGMAINPISKSKMIPFLGGIANNLLTVENPYAFQFWPNSEAEGSFLATILQKFNSKKSVILTAEDDYTMAVSNAAVKACKAETLEIVLNQQFAPTETDFRALALKLSKLNPDSIFVNAAISQLAPLIKQLRQMNIKANIISNFWLGKNEVISALGDFSEGLYFLEQTTDYQSLSKKLAEKFSASASGTTISGYTAVHMFNSALKLIPQDEAVSSENLYRALLTIDKISTENGTFNVIDRKVQFPLALKVIKGQKIEKAT